MVTDLNMTKNYNDVTLKPVEEFLQVDSNLTAMTPVDEFLQVDGIPHKPVIPKGISKIT